MPRSEARIFTSIWDEDDDFIDLSPDAKLLYLFLVTQATLSHCGVITITARKWGRKLGLDEDRLAAAMKEADTARYVVVDDHTEELLIRSLIRRDRIWQQPKMLRAALRAATQVESSRLRAAILTELRRLDPSQLPDRTRPEVTALLADLPPRLLSAAPRGPGDGGMQAPAEGVGQAPSEAPPEAPVHAPAEARREAPGQGGGGGGNGNGSNHRIAPIPNPPAPTPARASARPAAGAGMRPLWPASVADVPGEGEADLDALITEVKAIRAEMHSGASDWTTADIRRALANPDVIERGWTLARPAMLALAADPESQQPGRLAHGGLWWHRAATAAAESTRPPKPPHCGDPECDPNTRLVGVDRPKHCPNCHPLEVAS